MVIILEVAEEFWLPARLQHLLNCPFPSPGMALDGSLIYSHSWGKNCKREALHQYKNQSCYIVSYQLFPYHAKGQESYIEALKIRMICNWYTYYLFRRECNDVVDAVWTEIRVSILAISVVVVDLVPTHEQICTTHSPATSHTIHIYLVHCKVLVDKVND